VGAPKPQVDSEAAIPQVILAGESTLDGEYVSRIETLLADASLDDDVQLPGFVPAEDLPALYALADVFVMPSLEEGFGMCVVEAMAAGTPVVASRAGAMAQVVEDGRNGRLVDVGDVDGLAHALGDLLSSPDARERMGEQAQYRARDFSWPGIAEQFVEVYREVSE
jgi:glycosyltransferase involved in cell wall biosynthesis